MKYKITNISKNPPRPIFSVEAGRLLQPGDSCPANRVDEGTRKQEKEGLISIEEGRFLPPEKPPLKINVDPPTRQPSVSRDASEPLPGAWAGGERPAATASGATVSPVSADDIDGTGGDKPPTSVSHDASEPLPGAWVDGKRAPDPAPAAAAEAAPAGSPAPADEADASGKGGKGKGGKGKG